MKRRRLIGILLLLACFVSYCGDLECLVGDEFCQARCQEEAVDECTAPVQTPEWADLPVPFFPVELLPAVAVMPAMLEMLPTDVPPPRSVPEPPRPASPRPPPLLG